MDTPADIRRIALAVPKRLRGSNFRHAVEAVAALRHLDAAERAGLVPTTGPKDEQRAFQFHIARIVAQGGVREVAARWDELRPAHWREELVTEIGQAFHLWVDEGTMEVLIAALEDADPHVARRAPGPLIECVRERSEKERRQWRKTIRGNAALQAYDQARAWITPVRRGRVARAATATIERHVPAAHGVVIWPERYIELLGLTADRGDARAIAVLESIRPLAGEPRRSQVERLDPHNLPWPTSLLAAKKGIPPGTPIVRVWSVPTGLLDLKVLEEAIERIRRRA